MYSNGENCNRQLFSNDNSKKIFTKGCLVCTIILCMIIITYIACGKKRNAEAELSQFNHSIVSSWSSFWKDCDDSTPHKPLLQLNVRSEKCIVVCLKLAGIQVASTISSYSSPKCYLVLSIPPILQSTLMWLCVLL